MPLPPRFLAAMHSPPTGGIITNLRNHFLVATAQLNESYFERSLIYVCSHSDEGAMGVVINQPMKNISFNDVVKSMGIEDLMAHGRQNLLAPPTIFRGGPVENNRGFVLHSTDYKLKNSIDVGPEIRLSATSDIVTDMVKGVGPGRVNFCLGYAGWDEGQLEDEIAENSWLVLPASADLMFDVPVTDRYQTATRRMGLNALNFHDDIYGEA